MPESELYLVPLPTAVGGSQIGDPLKPGSRVTGPPSQKYPILRDLVSSPARVTLEVDTDHKRYIGIMKSISVSEPPGTASKPLLYMYMLHVRHQPLDPELGARVDRQARPIPLDQIIAFRVLKIQAEMSENGLVV